MASSSATISDSETIDDIDSTISDTISVQRQTVLARRNRSHTAFFFRIEEDFAYCQICEKDTNKIAYGYVRKGGNTSNLISHLRDKHNITKDNYLEFLDEDEEVYF